MRFVPPAFDTEVLSHDCEADMERRAKNRKKLIMCDPAMEDVHDFNPEGAKMRRMPGDAREPEIY